MFDPPVKPDTISFPHDYPFSEDVKRQMERRKEATNMVVTERITVIERNTYLPGAFSKLFQHKDLISGLSPYASKLFLYIGMNIGWMKTRIQLSPQLVGISKNVFYRAINELVFNQIIRKQESKKEWYWVNVTVVIYGNITDKQLTYK